MHIAAKLGLVALTIVITASSVQSALAPAAVPTDGPSYSAGDALRFPEQYRSWVFLTSGIDMSYTAAAQTGGMHMFGNVFVNPAAYATFIKTATWPTGTTFVTEFRAAQQKGSINKNGRFQTDLMGYDVHVKGTRFRGSWVFYAFDPGQKTGAKIPQTASCYSCHSSHAAVDTTFVQFYPTLLPIAMTKHTLSAAYQREEKLAR